jgi:hypothetical protein
MKILVMNLGQTEAWNYCAGEGQQQFNLPTELVSVLEDCWCSVVVSCCCYKVVAEARGQFGTPEEEERPLLEAATKQRQ